VNHQKLVEARTCEHRGLLAGTVTSVVTSGRRHYLRLTSKEPLSRGDGVMVEGGRAGAGERGGRIWDIMVKGQPATGAQPGVEADLWLGPDADVKHVQPGRRVFLNGQVGLEARVVAGVEKDRYRESVDVTIRGVVGQPFTLEARSARGLEARVTSEAAVQESQGRALDVGVLREKLGRLGETPYALRVLNVELPADAMIPLSELNRVRRALAVALRASGSRTHPTTDASAAGLLAAVTMEGRAPPPPGLFVLCRTLEQAEAAHAAGAAGVYLDFLALTGLSKAVERLRALRVPVVGVAPPRIRKPGEEKIDRFLESLQPDAVLVRGLGALHELSKAPVDGKRAVHIGDFSLNITNRLSASEVLRRGLDAFTPSFDLDAGQLTSLLSTPVGPFAEMVVHHPMPLFHMEHCLFAALLSTGKDFRDCGRPCESHVVSLRDRVGMDNPVEADIGCRNTIFHARAQSAASQVTSAQRAGCRRFRVELVRETPADVTRIVGAYLALMEGRTHAADVFKTLSTEGGVGVVRGSLRVL
jgi:putative protease